MREFGIVVSNEAAQSLFEYYASSGGPKDGQELNFDQYIIMMRGYLNPQRRNLVHRAFRKMDRDGSGVVDWNDLKGVYNVAQHPKVITGKISLSFKPTQDSVPSAASTYLQRLIVLWHTVHCRGIFGGDGID
jgi:Ca2+-binding EF-hand superfamily protein